MPNPVEITVTDVIFRGDFSFVTVHVLVAPAAPDLGYTNIDIEMPIRVLPAMSIGSIQEAAICRVRGFLNIDEIARSESAAQ
jgi:hypothetical protein